MNKENEIEEVEEIIEETVVICNDYLCGTHEAAENIINVGYRKAEEVRKETAKEILQDLYDEASRYCDDTMGLNTYEIKQLAKKYGVEVDE